MIFFPASLPAYSVIEPVVHFSGGSSQIREASDPTLQDVIEVLKSNPDINALLEGHSDSMEGNAEALSRRRAQAVKDYFVSHGIDSKRLLVDAFGATRPMATNETEAGRAQNRRVNFRVVESVSVFEGIRQVPVKELESKFLLNLDKANISQLEFLGRFYQVAYARRTSELPVETWGGKEYFAWAEGDPGNEEILASANPIPEREAESYLKKAISAFSEASKQPIKIYIAGKAHPERNAQRAADRGLIWCYWQKGQMSQAKKAYAKYLSAIGELDLGNFSAMKTDACLTPPAPEFQKDKRLNDATACYEKTLSQAATRPLGHYPNYIDDGKLSVKIKLASLQATLGSRDPAVASLKNLLQEALAFDQQLLQYPFAPADHAVQAWRELSPYLDPARDAAYIETTLNQLKSAKLQTNLPEQSVP